MSSMSICFPITFSRIRALSGFSVLIAAMTATAAPGDHLVTVNNPDPQTGARFGHSVDSYKGDILVGAPNHKFSDATNSGIAYRFNRGGSLVYPLLNPSPTNNDQFGFSIRGSKTNILIGAPSDEVEGASSGGAVHRAKGSTGQIIQLVASPAPLNNSMLGWDVFVLGNKFIAGAPGDNGANGATNAGAAYLLKKAKQKVGSILPRNARTTFLSPRGTPNDKFGHSVSAMGKLALIGAPGDDTGASDAGAAFSFNVKTGALQHIYENPAPAQSDEFGFAVAVIEDEADGNDGNRDPQVAVGAPEDRNINEVKSGRVFVFDSESGLLQLILENPNPATGDRFGAAVQNADGNILIGAPGHGSNTGIAYLFDGQTGALLATLNNPEPAANEEFGHSVAAVYVDKKGKDYDVNLVVGAPANEVGTEPSAGSVYLFEGFE